MLRLVTFSVLGIFLVPNFWQNLSTVAYKDVAYKNLSTVAYTDVACKQNRLRLHYLILRNFFYETDPRKTELLITSTPPLPLISENTNVLNVINCLFDLIVYLNYAYINIL